MAGTAIQIESSELTALTKRLRNYLRHVSRPKGGMAEVAAILESQTKRRIKDQKAAPGGGLWKAWSLKYLFTRHGNQSLLINEGHLYDDITGGSDTTKAEVFTTMVYGPTHQFGDSSRNIPARPFLGLGHRDITEVEQVFADWMNRQKL